MIRKDYSSYLVTLKPRFRWAKSVVPPWVSSALGELGQQEISGTEDNPRILEYLKTVDFGDQPLHDEVSWCSAFVQWNMLQCGIKGTGLGLAKSWLKWGKELQTLTFGCVVVFHRGSQKWMGHVGMLVDVHGNNLLVLGGNQSNRVCIRPYPLAKLAGYKWPG